ncbi:MAG: hypothetical protein V3U65_15455 [Granulosicoccaceae bacterium]
MSKIYFNNHLLVLLLLLAPLVACVTEGEADSAAMPAEPTDIVTQGRSIDWDRAGEDASVNDAGIKKQIAAAGLAVPLLLPPPKASVSDPSGQIKFVDPRIVSDTKGYSAVIASDNFDMLIDASNQMILTGDVTSPEYPQDFDGKFQFIEMGSQLTIGRYGALYAIQFICTGNNDGDCVDEQTAREIVQSLQVLRP